MGRINASTLATRAGAGHWLGRGAAAHAGGLRAAAAAGVAAVQCSHCAGVRLVRFCLRRARPTASRSRSSPAPLESHRINAKTKAQVLAGRPPGPPKSFESYFWKSYGKCVNQTKNKKAADTRCVAATASGWLGLDQLAQGGIGGGRVRVGSLGSCANCSLAGAVLQEQAGNL